jgi:hypothetical protein
VYADGHSTLGAPVTKSTYPESHVPRMPSRGPAARPPGSVVSWEKKRAELGELSGDVELLKNIWTTVDSLANTYIWQLLLSF